MTNSGRNGLAVESVIFAVKKIDVLGSKLGIFGLKNGDFEKALKGARPSVGPTTALKRQRRFKRATLA